MRAGILAAGAGSRFVEAGWEEPKPLIRIKDKAIISHVLDNLFTAGVENVDVLLNGEKRFDPVEAHLKKMPEARRIRVWRRTTRSSYESFCFLLERLEKPPFLISTVDSILAQEDLNDFLKVESYPVACSLALAVTDFVHDDNPLWVDLNQEGKITRIGDRVPDKRHVTAGLYLILRDLKNHAADHRFSALRHYLKHLTESGVSVWGKKFRVALDIDSPGDIQVAESFLQQERHTQN